MDAVTLKRKLVKLLAENLTEEEVNEVAIYTDQELTEVAKQTYIVKHLQNQGVKND